MLHQHFLQWAEHIQEHLQTNDIATIEFIHSKEARQVLLRILRQECSMNLSSAWARSSSGPPSKWNMKSSTSRLRN
ncbi:hypothetical protein D3C74_30320 [compost metagenome]